MKMSILEVHGIADAEKAMMANDKRQSVLVIDGEGKVLLTLSDPPTAGLSPDRARVIGKALIDSAARVQNAKKAAHLNVARSTASA
jgi:hypothetical protein